jgi:hypothetical protein
MDDWIEMKDRSKVMAVSFSTKRLSLRDKIISYPTRFYFFITFNFMNFKLYLVLPLMQCHLRQRVRFFEI